MRKHLPVIAAAAVLTLGGGVFADDKECPAPPPKDGIDFSLPCIKRLDLIPEKDEKVFFDAASFRLSQEAMAILDRQAEALRRHPNLRVETIGFADTVEAPTSDAKVALGRMRAAEVRRHLIEKGVASDRIVAVGRDWSPMVPRREDDATLAAMRYVRTQAAEPRESSS